MKAPIKGRVLIIAGSDSSGGAGIQADLKTVMALGSYGMTAITAITVQNTLGVSNIHAVPPQIVKEQIEACLSDIGADVIKTGMLHDAALINAVASALQGTALPLVIDPVMAAKGGHALLEESASSALKKKLLPLATLITPNLPEAEILLNRKISNAAEMPEAAKEIAIFGAKAVLLKGGHLEGDAITDVLWDGKSFTQWQSPRVKTTSTHGTGCTLASAIATGLAQGKSLKEAVNAARHYVIGALKAAPGLGKGHGPLNHGWRNQA